MSTPGDVISPATLREWQLPGVEGGKHSRGHAVVVGGSTSTPGAVLLAGIAALRVGAGVLAMGVPEEVAIPLAVEVPEAGVTPLGGDLKAVVEQADALLIGPGFADPQTTERVLREVLPVVPDKAPVALDAFALGVLSDLRELCEPLAGRLVLTPNTQEARRLLGLSGDEDPGSDAGPRMARQWHAVVSYQGAISAPDGSERPVLTGHAGLGTSGSGDVLAGAVLGLLARGAQPDQAAAWATYLHAAAGDRLAARVGRLGFLARELADELPVVLTELQS